MFSPDDTTHQFSSG
jgi:hypothetical protein